MAFGGGGGTSRVRSDINVTPLVDVVLVMLIIFLVAMPVLMRNITIDIPKKSEENVEIVAPDQITVEVQEGGVIVLNGQTIERSQLAERLKARLESKREKIVFVDFHNKTRYGDAVQIMDLVKGAGAKIALKMKDTSAPAPGAPGTPAPAPVTPPQ